MKSSKNLSKQRYGGLQEMSQLNDTSVLLGREFDVGMIAKLKFNLIF